MRKLVAAAVILGLFTAPAFAKKDCGAEIGKVDKALATAKLSEGDTKKVKDARAKAEDLQKAKKNDECVKSLKEAKKLLGLKKEKKK